MATLTIAEHERELRETKQLIVDLKARQERLATEIMREQANANYLSLQIRQARPDKLNRFDAERYKLKHEVKETDNEHCKNPDERQPDQQMRYPQLLCEP
jgi:hypothetical protein